MELTAQNLNYLLAVIALASVAFTVWNKVSKPQVDSEKKDALLAQQVQWQTEATERRFTEMQGSIEKAFLLAQNHVHTVDTKVESLTTIITSMGNQIVKLQTILEERLPK